ncbi:hypothetical protein EVAR_63836_1 [Eumeta japonica]|uniref:Uncharacterized protein n=1 Tax=Eumeta variegata TaxID=151549 RepID=A0A4C1ZCL1_EUMVA|nr:hypothetical protein EVAR_63836_1 [Eumeta japonica]
MLSYSPKILSLKFMRELHAPIHTVMPFTVRSRCGLGSFPVRVIIVKNVADRGRWLREETQFGINEFNFITLIKGNPIKAVAFYGHQGTPAECTRRASCRPRALPAHAKLLRAL